MSMTPERIEEIKVRLSDRQARRGYLEREEMELMELLAALEESQQEQEYAKQQAIYWNDEAVKFKRQLAEAQQTIARQREALEQIMDVTGVDYEDSFNKAIRVAFLALGLGEGAKES